MMKKKNKAYIAAGYFVIIIFPVLAVREIIEIYKA